RALPCGDADQRPGNDGEAGSTGKTARITRLPLRQQAVVVEAKARRLFGEVDVEGGAGKRRAERKSELTCKHGHLLQRDRIGRITHSPARRMTAYCNCPTVASLRSIPPPQPERRAA